ncbi:hypothetical protein EDB85DRAFT_1873549, partial [Lactarius pseudohatsudake]
TSCLAIKSTDPDGHYYGLFDIADVNAFLTFAATRYMYTPEHLQSHPRVAQILETAKAGHVPVQLVRNLSEKNPLVELAHDVSVITLLAIFSSGAHRVLVKSPAGSSESHLGVISDLRLLTFFSAFAHTALSDVLALCLGTLPLPLLNLHFEVVAVHSRKSVLDAMRMMSDLGVSSVAVLEEERCLFISSFHRSSCDQGSPLLLGCASPSLFIRLLRMPQGWTDGADRYPVYSVFPSSTLSYTIQKVLATNSHRLFVTSESNGSASPSAGLRGICPVSSRLHIHYYSLGLACWKVAPTVLSLFARISNNPDVDPARMQRHRRASSGVFAEHVRSASTGSLWRTSVPRAA